MNYRHAFHAGNFADVVKHAVLSLIVDHLLKKDAAIFALDTHAGIGRYDFWTLAPNKTEEYKNGIGRIWQDESAPDALSPYLRLVRGMNGTHLRHYPGSPYLLRQLLRPQDRLVLAEKHPEDAGTLKTLFHGDKQVAVHLADGWQSLKAFLPPKEKRGLVLIDPAFEEGGEYERLAQALIAARQRWPQGILIGWHPIKDEGDVQALYARLQESEIPSILAVRHLVRTPSDAKMLNGAGLVVLNPPYRLDETLRPSLDWLAEKLAQEDGAAAALDWISKDV
jgi:23S rRNA (adenine2030-N6)-methyltransferase